MSGFLDFIGSVFWIILSIVNAFGAKNRERSFIGYLFLSLICSPLFGAYLLIVLGDKINGNTTKGDLFKKKVARNENDGIML